MADSGTIDKERFTSPQIDEDDPLMELSRIIGLEPRRETVSRYAPAPRADALSEPNVEAEALVAPSEISDVLQKDLAEELIASLNSDDDFSPLDAEDDQAAPTEMQAEEQHASTESDPHGAGYAEEPVPHMEVSLASAADNSSSLEDELEAILNPETSRHSLLGLRPAEDVSEADEDEAGGSFERAAAEALEPVAAFEGAIEPVAEVNVEPEYEDAALQQAPSDDVEPVPQPVEADADDYWSRVARRAAQAPADVPEQAATQAAALAYPQEVPQEAVAAAYESAHPAEPQFEPVVDVIAHEARGVEMTGDLDVPEFEYAAHEARQGAAALDDEYDAEYAQAYQQPSPASVSAAETSEYEDEEYDQTNEAVAELEQERGHSSSDLGQAAAAAAGAAARQIQPRRDFVLDDDDNFGASLDVPLAPASVRRSSGRSYLMAAGLGALALLGGIGAFALTRGGDAAAPVAAPVVLKADSSPVKVAPETPGGKVVPNQDIAVFDKAAGAAPAEAAQTALVSKTEAPVDLAEKAAPRVVLPEPVTSDPALREAVAAPSAAEANAKAEDRVAEQPADEVSLVKTEVASVSPKKVRTMVVKSDGTLEERAASAEPAAAPDPVETAMTAPAESAVPAKKVPTSAVLPGETVGAVSKAADAASVKSEEIITAAAAPEAAAADPAAEVPAAAATEAAPAEPKSVVKPVKVKKLSQKAAKAEALKEVAAANIPLVDGRPSDQPVTIVGKTGKTPQAEEVAALVPTAAPAPAGSYVIQIASATSPDAAQATWASLNRKYGNVLGGRNAKIQKADIPGKGTFYRVRIPAGSKQEATALCAKYKSVGGQCLVAR